jgi:hypothetical protein
VRRVAGDRLQDAGVRCAYTGRIKKLRVTMQRIISLLLASLLLVAVVDRPAQAADGSHLSAAELKAAKQKERLSTIPIGGSVRLKVKDGTQYRGRLSARGDDVFEVETPKPVTVSYLELKWVKRIDVAPRISNSFRPGRALLIAGFFLAAILIIAVVELRKS